MRRRIWLWFGVFLKTKKKGKETTSWRRQAHRTTHREANVWRRTHATLLSGSLAPTLPLFFCRRLKWKHCLCVCVCDDCNLRYNNSTLYATFPVHCVCVCAVVSVCAGLSDEKRKRTKESEITSAITASCKELSACVHLLSHTSSCCRSLFTVSPAAALLVLSHLSLHSRVSAFCALQPAHSLAHTHTQLSKDKHEHRQTQSQIAAHRRRWNSRRDRARFFFRSLSSRKQLKNTSTTNNQSTCRQISTLNACRQILILDTSFKTTTPTPTRHSPFTTTTLLSLSK